jgi:hypothetical protein
MSLITIFDITFKGIDYQKYECITFVYGFLENSNDARFFKFKVGEYGMMLQGKNVLENEGIFFVKVLIRNQVFWLDHKKIKVI